MNEAVNKYKSLAAQFSKLQPEEKNIASLALLLIAARDAVKNNPDDENLFEDIILDLEEAVELPETHAMYAYLQEVRDSLLTYKDVVKVEREGLRYNSSKGITVNSDIEQNARSVRLQWSGFIVEVVAYLSKALGYTGSRVSDNQTLLTDEEYDLVIGGTPINKDFFFVLSINFAKTEDCLMFTTELRDGIAGCNNFAYASKVSAGGTLAEAIRADLTNDFSYKGNFSIEALKRYDETTDRKGNVLTRLHVFIKVDERFDTDELNTLGMNPHWHNDSGHPATAKLH